MASEFITIPGTGATSWRYPVPTAVDLPSTGNQPGDAIAVEDTGVIYVWDGSAWVTGSGGGSGTVTSIAVETANGFAGTVANPTTSADITIKTTITGVLQGNGTAISAYSPGNFTDSTSGADGITVTNGTAAVFGSGTSIAQAQASASHNGYLDSTDWSTFNGKQASGSYITALTGDVTASGPGSAVTTLATVNADTSPVGSSTSIPTITANSKGLVTAVTGNVVIAPAGTLSGTTLNSTVVNSSLTSVGTLTTGVWNGTVTSGFSFVTSGTTYTTPAGITSATLFKFTLIGGGGGSAGTNTANLRSGGGGSGGGVRLYTTGLSANTAYTIAIGAGGTAGAATPTSGGAGGSTTLTIGATTYTAGGGAGSTTGTNQFSAAGGTATGGTINIVGQGGGCNAVAGTQTVSGFGGTPPFGLGIGGPNLTTETIFNVAFAGTGYGAGSGGAGGTGCAGASGTQGCILVEWQN